MNKFYLFLMVLLLPLLGYSQDNDASGSLTAGVKLGGSINYLWGDGATSQTVKPLPGISAGAYLRYKLTEKISIQPELLFSTRGLSIQHYLDQNQDLGFYSSNPTLPAAGYDQSYPYSARTRVDIFYLDLPVMLGYSITEDLTIQAGAIGSLNIWDSYPRTYTSDNVRIKADKDFTRINPWEVSAVLGAAYNFEVSGHKITAGARVNVGFTRINDAQRANNDLKSCGGQIFLAYDLFNLK